MGRTAEARGITRAQTAEFATSAPVLAELPRSVPAPPTSSRVVTPGIRTAALDLPVRRAFGPLLGILDEPELRDVLVQVGRHGGELWLDYGAGPRRVAGWDADPAAITRFATRIVAAGGRHIDELHPCVDVRIGDGIRVHAVLPPIAVSGAAVSIRLPRTVPLTFDELTEQGLCTDAVAAWLASAVRQRLNLLITGGTGAGKTTVLGALLDLAEPNERIVTIEDVAELRLRHAHVVALQARQANTEGAGAVHLDALLREALRMRPDRIVLGECRGAEISTLLTAFNTGHDGGAGTLHASGIADVPARLEALGSLAGLAPEPTARQVVAGVHGVVHLERDARGHRVAAVGKLTLDRGDRLAVEPIA